MKKLLSLLLSFMLLFSIASCGASGGDTEGDGGGVTDGENSGAGDVNGRDETEPREIVIELSEATQYGLLGVSTAGKITAGIKDGTDEIDREVALRNGEAARIANVTVRYKYLPDIPENAAYNNVNRIKTETRIYSPDSTDIYYNHSIDIVIAVLSNAFANLYEDGTAGETLFRFNADDYDGSPREGYYYDYMRSISLSSDKIYAVASDYGLDFARMFTAIPTNIALLRTASQKLGNSAENDAIEEITEIVKSGDWTFDTLARYANAAFVEKLSENSASLTDAGEVIGFGVGSNHMIPALALLNSSSASTVTRTPIDGDPNRYFIDLPDDNRALFDICAELNELFNEPSVYTLKEKSVLKNSGNNQTLLREFNEGRMLFGEITTLCMLEGTVKPADDPLLFLPVPTYKKASDIGYNTTVSPFAKVFAISAKTDVFRECALFLNYQSTHSEDIAKDYLIDNLGIRGDGELEEAAKEMLDIILSSVRDSFLPIWEQICYFGKIDFDPYLLTYYYVCDSHYELSDFEEYYRDYVSLIRKELDKLMSKWEQLD